MEARAICTDALGCFYDFQTLISGVLAIIAAVAAALAVVYSARLPVQHARAAAAAEEARRRIHAGFVLASHLRLLRSRARHVAAIMRVTIAANAEITDANRGKLFLRMHPIIEDWEFMSALPTEFHKRLLILARMVEDHNYDMERAGGSFGDDNFRQHVQNHVVAVENMANTLIGEAELIRRGESPYG